MASSTTWDPWGQVLASAGPAIQLGYQGQWNDPVTGQVNMGARMYRPAAGGFINQDTYTGGQGAPAVTGNLHAYASDNPMTFTDPTGHVTQIEDGGGPTITAADVNAERARAEAAAQTAARLSAQAGQAAQQAAQAQYAAQSATALARTLNVQATQLEAEAAKARAYAQQWYQYAQGKLAGANYLLNRASAELSQAQAIANQIDNYDQHGDFRAAQQYIARYGNEENALYNAAANDNYYGTLDAEAYARLQGWVGKFTQIADQLTSQARQARAEAQAQAQAANHDAASAAALNAKARQLAAAAAAARRHAAALQAQYQSDQQYYHDEQVYAAANAPKPKSSTAHSTGQGIYSSSMGCVTAQEFKYGACPGEAGAAGTTSQQVRQSFTGAAIIIGGAIFDPVVGGILRGLLSSAPAAINTGDVAVYISTNAAGDVNYVGITNNVARRAAEQLAQKAIYINEIPGLTNLSRADARAVEQVLLEDNGGPGGGQLLNKINSIARTNPIYAQSIRRGCYILSVVGYAAPNVC
jgi:RHS repeat-associated protein